MERESADVVVIGAGAAGVAAARELSRAGKSVVLLEARGRVGGRIHTVHEAGWPVAVELGAEFVHGRPKSTWEVLRGMGAAGVYDVTDTHWHFDGGKLEKRDFWEEIEGVLARLEKIGKRDMSFEAFLKKHARGVSADAKAMATGFVEGFNATDRNRVSAQFLKAAQAAADEIEETKSFRLFGGYDGILAYLTAGWDPAGVRVRLSTVVMEIKWSKGSVRVRAMGVAGEEREVRARAVVVTLPVGVLQLSAGEEGAVAFEPEIASKRRAWEGMRMGPVVKAVVRFREAFWEEKEEWREMCFLHASGLAFPTCWTMLPVRAAVMTGWAGGPAADRLGGRSARGVLEAFLGTIGQAMGMSIENLAGLVQAWHVADWQRDPFARGAYSYALVGGAGGPAELARPVAGTVFFAGEHTHAGETGTVAAAIESGQRAARQILGAG